MIECVNGNIYYNKKRKRPKKKVKRFFVFFIILLILTGLYFYTDKVIYENIFSICFDTARSISAKAVSECIYENSAGDKSYSDLVLIEKNTNGDISLITFNTAKINALNRSIALYSEEKIKLMLKEGIPVPLLAFSGIPILSGYGTKIGFKSFYITSVTCNIRDDFSSAGINQTLHSVYLDIESEFTLEVPLKKKSDKALTSVLISESVIVGKIPEIYLNR